MTKPAKQRWKLRDLRDSAEGIMISDWSLDTPATQYTATSSHYGHQSGVAVIHFAQMVGRRPMNALAIVLPPESISEWLLPHLGPIRERLERLDEMGKIEPVPPLDLELLSQFDSGANYLQKAADRVRVAAGDSFAALDFFKLPVVPPALIEARPNETLDIEDVVRVMVPTSLFVSLLQQMETVEGYQTKDDPNARDD